MSILDFFKRKRESVEEPDATKEASTQTSVDSTSAEPACISNAENSEQEAASYITEAQEVSVSSEWLSPVNSETPEQEKPSDTTSHQKEVEDEDRNFCDELTRVKVGDKYGYIDKNGAYIIEPEFDDAGDFCEGVARVNVGKGVSRDLSGLCLVEWWSDGKWGYIDRSGAYIVKPRFEDAKDFRGGIAKVKVDGKWRYINKSGAVLKMKR